MKNNHSSESEFSITVNPKPSATLAASKKLGVVIGIILLTAGGLRLSINQVEAENLKQRNTNSLTRSVIGVHSKPAEATHKLVLPANLRGSSETQIYSRTNGYLSAWYKTIGDPVKKGDLLAVIDVPELEQELAQSRAAMAQIKVRLELAESTLKRWTSLKETDSVIQQEFDEKKSAFHQAQADLAAADVNVKRLEKLESYRRIVAPFSGVVTRRSIDVGNLITATGTQELFAISQTDPIRLTVWVPQAYADDIQAGQEVSVRQISSKAPPVAAKVEHVAGALDLINRSRQVDITLPNNDGKLLPGAYVEISINVANRTNPLIVPANVLVMDQAGTHVVVVDSNNQIVFRPVTLGRDFGRELEVLTGIAANETLVASPSDLLVEGETVNVVEPPHKANAPKT